jgi:hypothetical protein
MGKDYTATFTVDRTPAEAFAAINNPRAWWGERIEGGTEKLGDVFTYEVPGVHYCRMELTEVVPDRKVVWHVSDSSLEFVTERDEWDDTDVVFEVAPADGGAEVRMTHVGLDPEQECYLVCSDAWGGFITGSLRRYIETGEGEPIRVDDVIDIVEARERHARFRASV